MLKEIQNLQGVRGMATPQSLFIKNTVAFLLGMIIIRCQQVYDTHQMGYLFIGGYVLLSLYHSWQFYWRHHGNQFSSVIFLFLPFTLVFTIFVSLNVGFLTSIPRFIYCAYQWRKQSPIHERVPANHTNVIPFHTE